MKKIFCLILFSSCSLAFGAEGVSKEERQSYVRMFTDTYPMLEDFTSEEWYVWAVFFDIDGDASMDALVASTDQDYTDGCLWSGLYMSTNGVIQRVLTQVAGREDYELYVYEHQLKAPVLAECGVLHTQKDAQGIPQYEDNFIVLTTNKQEIVCESMTGGIEEWICKPRFRRLSRAPLWKYEGFDLREKVYDDFTPLPTHET